MLGLKYRLLWGIATGVILTASVTANAVPSSDVGVAELKARLANTGVGDRTHLCIQIAQLQLVETDKLYAAAENEKAEGALTDVVAFSELARDYAIQSHKNQKQTEIAVRGIARKLSDMMHALGHDERKPVQDAINRLQRVRDDLLSAMFSKGAK
jgi:hypothetical protein